MFSLCYNKAWPDYASEIEIDLGGLFPCLVRMGLVGCSCQLCRLPKFQTFPDLEPFLDSHVSIMIRKLVRKLILGVQRLFVEN